VLCETTRWCLPLRPYFGGAHAVLAVARKAESHRSPSAVCKSTLVGISSVGIGPSCTVAVTIHAPAVVACAQSAAGQDVDGHADSA
jgi:hypothetical protein